MRARRFVALDFRLKSEVDALGVITISRGCFERCCRNKKTAFSSVFCMQQFVAPVSFVLSGVSLKR